MVPGKLDHQVRRANSSEFDGAADAVVAIRLHPPGQRKMRFDKEGSQRPPNRAETSIPLAHIVEQRGLDRLWFDDSSGNDNGCTVIPVRLVPWILGKEQSLLGLPQPTADLNHLNRAEGPGGEKVEETSGKMWDRARHLSVRT